jgi:hypothetical protein
MQATPEEKALGMRLRGFLGKIRRCRSNQYEYADNTERKK